MPAYVYILASRSKRLYTGVTSDLKGRMYQHKTKSTGGFTARYNIDRLLYFETGDDMLAANAREKQIKGWTRAKKIALIEATNPSWLDLSEGWFDA